MNKDKNFYIQFVDSIEKTINDYKKELQNLSMNMDINIGKCHICKKSKSISEYDSNFCVNCLFNIDDKLSPGYLCLSHITTKTMNERIILIMSKDNQTEIEFLKPCTIIMERIKALEMLKNIIINKESSVNQIKNFIKKM